MRFGKRWVLCVDDDHDTCEIIQIYFSDWEVRTAASAAQALLSAKRRIFNLYLLDSWLPGQDGIELCRKIRRFDPNTPILFYSAAAYPGDRDAAIEAGAQDYIVKPVDPQFLKQRAESLVMKAELRDLEARTVEWSGISDYTLGAKRRESRAAAYRLFLSAGGTRANFSRFWSQHHQRANVFAAGNND